MTFKIQFHTTTNERGKSYLQTYERLNTEVGQRETEKDRVRQSESQSERMSKKEKGGREREKREGGEWEEGGGNVERKREREGRRK